MTSHCGNTRQLAARAFGQGECLSSLLSHDNTPDNGQDNGLVEPGVALTTPGDVALMTELPWLL